MYVCLLCITGCDIKDIVIQWEKSEYILQTNGEMSDYGVKVCAVAADVFFPVWFRFNTNNPEGKKIPSC